MFKICLEKMRKRKSKGGREGREDRERRGVGEIFSNLFFVCVVVREVVGRLIVCVMF